VKPDPRFDDLLRQIAPLSPDEYYRFVFHFDETHYRTRVEMAGFVGADRVLDAGCGYGQWAVALAAANGRVVALDVSPNMIATSRIVARRYGVTNVDFQVAAMPRLPFKAESFDLVWCWGVMMFLDRGRALAEFHRVLRPGGRLLVGCVNGVGRWLFKAVRALHPLRFRPLVVRAAAQAVLRGAGLDAMPNRTSMRQCRRLCEQFGFELVAAGFDGTIDVTRQRRKKPMFAPRFLGFENNIEYLARRVG
jgi:SAM-dependent methyltransferase